MGNHWYSKPTDGQPHDWYSKHTDGQPLVLKTQRWATTGTQNAAMGNTTGTKNAESATYLYKTRTYIIFPRSIDYHNFFTPTNVSIITKARKTPFYSYTNQ
jgi:hypothetical protein